MTLENRADLLELTAHAKVINWLAEGSAPYQPDLAGRIHMVAELAEKLAEDAYELASKLEKENSND